MLDTSSRADTLTRAYTRVRDFTERLAEPLSAEDQTVQSMPDVSPTKWHRAHTTWFFETFLLRPFVPGYRTPDEGYDYLFNSYYEAVGDRHPRDRRGLISRPSSTQVGDYRTHVDAAMADFLATLVDENGPLLDLVELGLHHEQQHQELLLMDIKHVLSCNPTFPRYQDVDQPPPSAPAPLTWTPVRGGDVHVGHAGNGFAFDNEAPAHRVALEDFALADRLVTCGEWLEFIEDGGYDRPEYWLSEGWGRINVERWRAPEYWHEIDGAWHVFTLNGLQAVDPAEPVVHVSLYEADAYARWADARLPTEFEWERAATDAAIDGNFVDSGRLHPAPAAPEGGPLRQLFGDVWEWTNSAYLPYPGFRPAEGAVGEYNGKFMVNQHVLRGGCCATSQDHVRPTYRNFFPAHSRWMFSGVRLAKDLR